MTAEVEKDDGNHVLVVEHDGSRVALADSVTFGRTADLVIGNDNPYLHRCCGMFFRSDTDWHVKNTGSRLTITVEPDGHPRSEIAPGQQATLLGSAGVVRIIGGPTTHRLRYEHANAAHHVR